MLLAMIVTFVVVRVITRKIREGKWGLHNIAPGGLHIHHVVFGVVAMLLAGIVGIAFRLSEPGLDVVAVVFGIGAALTVDEFALLLHLEDVYWSREGRENIEAVILFGGLVGRAVGRPLLPCARTGCHGKVRARADITHDARTS